MQTLIHAVRVFNRKDLNTAKEGYTNAVFRDIMHELAGKLMAHLVDGCPWLVQMNDFAKRDSVLNPNREISRTIGVVNLADLLPILNALNELVNSRRLEMELWYKANPDGQFKNEEPKMVQVDERLLIALLQTVNIPITRSEENGGTGKETPAESRSTLEQDKKAPE